MESLSSTSTASDCQCSTIDTSQYMGDWSALQTTFYENILLRRQKSNGVDANQSVLS